MSFLVYPGEHLERSQIDHLPPETCAYYIAGRIFVLHRASLTQTHIHTYIYLYVLKAEPFNCVATPAADNLPGGKLTFPQLLPVLKSPLHEHRCGNSTKRVEYATHLYWRSALFTLSITFIERRRTSVWCQYSHYAPHVSSSL